MKRPALLTFVALFACLGLSAPASAIPMATTGGIDLLLASAEVSPSNPANDEAWVESILGMDVTFSGQTDTGLNWSLVDGEIDVYAHELESDPQYHLIRTSSGNLLGHTHFLFQNLFSLSYAVIDLSSMGFDPSQTLITSVEQLTEFNGSVTRSGTVPEPASVVLLALGLLALAAGNGTVAMER